MAIEMGLLFVCFVLYVILGTYMIVSAVLWAVSYWLWAKYKRHGKEKAARRSRTIVYGSSIHAGVQPVYGACGMAVEPHNQKKMKGWDKS